MGKQPHVTMETEQSSLMEVLTGYGYDCNPILLR